jgi:acetone carboxylase gamma subunit
MGQIAIVGEKRNAYRTLVGRCECKKPFGKPKRRWETNIQLSLTEIG